MKTFCIAGPVKPEDHYYIPHRLDENEVRKLIEEKKYFILHAPRQSGKTTAILSLVKQLNTEGTYKALYINVESAQAARSDFKEGMKIILKEFIGWVKLLLPSDTSLIGYAKEEVSNPSGSSLKQVLQDWCTESDKPILLFIDEIDSLVGDTLISVLRQLRAGYPNRPQAFPQSVCLFGVRDVRDYRIWSEHEHELVLGGSAFNIKAKSLTLPNFSLEQVRDLYHQHTQETGQQFTDEAIEYAYYVTQGQPWLINAVAYQACFRDVTDRTVTITKEIIEQAKETLILRRDTHIDQLVHKLAEPRVRTIIDAIISGETIPSDFPIDDLSYVIDLGLVTKVKQQLQIANPMYREVIPRELSYGTQLSITQQLVWYQNKDGSLNMHKLLESFTQFYREHSDIWREKFNYKESGPHLLLMAFLQRIINGGGKIHREYALGRKRVDLLLEWSTETEKTQRIVIELKIKRTKSEKVLEQGLEQTAQYMDINNATEGHLLIFDDSGDKSWDERIFTQAHTVGKYAISVWGM